MTTVEGQIARIMAAYDPQDPAPAAGALRSYWLTFQPASIEGISAAQRARQETVGIPIADLRAIAKALLAAARPRLADLLPLLVLLWDEYGREGRVIALIPLGRIELQDPETVIPMLRRLCRTCVTWEDADRLAMDALEPVVRRDPDTWLPAIAPWLEDEVAWVRRAGATVVGRLPIKHASYTARCLELVEPLLGDPDTDVKRAVSFAIRLCARGDVAPVRALLARHVPPDDPEATWVLCDAIRSMAVKLLPAFAGLLPLYERWAGDERLGARERRSVESAVRVLRSAGGGQK